MYCTPDCTCSLCRELRGFRPKLVLIDRPPKTNSDRGPSSSLTQKQPQIGNDNFILRRRRFSEFDFGRQYGKPPINPLRAKSKPLTPDRQLSCSTSNIVAEEFKSTATEKRKECEPTENDLGAATITKSRSCSDVWRRPELVIHQQKDTPVRKLDQQHKVVIYFGDSLSSKQQLQQAAESFNDQVKDNHTAGCDEVINQLQNVVIEKNRGSSEFSKPASVATTTEGRDDSIVVETNTAPREKGSNKMELPSFVDSIENNIINVKIEGSFRCALDIVNSVINADEPVSIGLQSHSDNSFDWSFVQEWRTR